MTTCSIVRFRFLAENEVIYTGVPFEEAKELCSKEWSHGDGWFDGWTIEENEEDEDEA